MRQLICRLAQRLCCRSRFSRRTRRCGFEVPPPTRQCVCYHRLGHTGRICGCARGLPRLRVVFRRPVGAHMRCGQRVRGARDSSAPRGPGCGCDLLLLLAVVAQLWRRVVLGLAGREKSRAAGALPHRDTSVRDDVEVDEYPDRAHTQQSPRRTSMIW